jgi:hypothetical protein
LAQHSLNKLQWNNVTLFNTLSGSSPSASCQSSGTDAVAMCSLWHSAVPVCWPPACSAGIGPALGPLGPDGHGSARAPGSHPCCCCWLSDGCCGPGNRAPGPGYDVRRSAPDG